MQELSRSVEEMEELEEGYRFQYRAGTVEWASLAEFVELERRCCPFLTFTARVGPDGAPLSLALTGREGVKAYLREQSAGVPGPDE